MDLSIIIPCLNEEENLDILVKRTNDSLNKNNIDTEIILVDDGSTDGSQDVMQRLRDRYSNLIILRHEKTKGISEAWKTGLKQCKSKYVFTTDADLQYLPEDIPLLYSEILNGYDIVQGWREQVLDGYRLRRIQSLAFSSVLNLVFSINLKDAKSGFVVYKKEVFEDILNHKFNYNYFHQLITVAAKSKNYTIKQLPVKFFKRNAGESFLGHLPLRFIINTLPDLVKAMFEYK
jgi:phenylacetate-CoA ligase